MGGNVSFSRFFSSYWKRDLKDSLFQCTGFLVKQHQLFPILLIAVNGKTNSSEWVCSLPAIYKLQSYLVSRMAPTMSVCFLVSNKGESGEKGEGERKQRPAMMGLKDVYGASIWRYEQSQGELRAAMKHAELASSIVCQDAKLKARSQHPSSEVSAWPVPVLYYFK